MKFDIWITVDMCDWRLEVGLKMRTIVVRKVIKNTILVLGKGIELRF